MAAPRTHGLEEFLVGAVELLCLYTYKRCIVPYGPPLALQVVGLVSDPLGQPHSLHLHPYHRPGL